MKKFGLSMESVGLLACAALIGASPARATTYDINLVENSFALHGTITTDGASGPLTTSDIVDWNLTMSDNSMLATFLGPLSGSNSILFNPLSSNLYLSASPTGLFYNFTPLFTSEELQFRPALNISIPTFGIDNAFNGTGDVFFIDSTFNDGEFPVPNGGQFGTVSAVPELSTWAMMILGFCGIGFMAYRRKQNGLAFRVA
jgi:hypothetical protein